MSPETMSEYWKKIRYAASFLRRGLVHTNLQVLYRCNFRCRICDFWKDRYREKPMLSLQQVETISEKMSRIGPQIVSIGGGEPLLHPRIADIVRALARHHFPVMICNGWFVTPERARALFDAGMHEISVSVDYPDPEKHDAQRGMPGSHERAVKALEILHSCRTRPFQRVHMISVIMEDNLSDVEALIGLCRKLGITYLITLYSNQRGCRAHRDSAADPSAVLMELQRKSPQFVALRGYLAGFTRAVRDAETRRCYAGKNLCNIDSEGNISLCIDRMDRPVGNILVEDAEEIHTKLLAAFNRNACRSCWTSCRGSIETVMYGTDKTANLRDYYRMVKSVPLDGRTPQDPGASLPHRADSNFHGMN